MKIKYIYIWAFNTSLFIFLAFYVEIDGLKGVEIENLKSTVTTIDFDNHYDFIQIRKKMESVTQKYSFLSLF